MSLSSRVSATIHLAREAIRQYQLDGICTDYVRRVDGQPTGTAAIVVDDQAENCIIVIPGANAHLSRSDIQRAASVIEQADAIVCQLETPIDATLEAFRIARGKGKLTVLTPAPVIDLPDELLSLCDLCIPNRTEIEVLTSRVVSCEQDAHAAADLLRARGVRAVALTMGGDGAFIVNDTKAMHIPAMKVAAVDTTGAGDAFSAALTVFLCEGYSLHEAASRASVVGALTVTRIGTHSAFPRREKVLQAIADASTLHFL